MPSHNHVRGYDPYEPPGLTPEARENQLIALAIDLAEKQLADGSASPSVISHYLRLGSTKERLEKERLIQENALLRAKTKALEDAKSSDELYSRAIEAMKSYHSIAVEDDG